MDAIVLAGGQGTRLRAVVADRPKPLALVRGRAFLLYLLDQLCDAGLQRAILSVGYMADIVEQAIGPTYREMQIAYSRETEPLGTAGGVRRAASQSISDPILVMNGDSYFRVNLPAFLNRQQEHPESAALTVVRVPDASRFGSVELSEHDRIIHFGEKSSGAAPSWINAGIYLIPSRLLSAIPPDRPLSLERDLFPAWARAGLYAFRDAGPFIDIGTPESLAAAERFFAEN